LIKHWIRAAAVAPLFFAQAVYGANCDGVVVDVCFRPGVENCMSRIVQAIDTAHDSVYVQAYNFSTPEIIQAIRKAKQRGLQVRVLLDKENRQKRYTAATYLANGGVSVRIDDKVAIAHNKIVIIDNALVIGGSYNYTRSAEARNAENVTLMKSECMAAQFMRNFEARWETADAVVLENQW
jgi:phosphatidylserine/phosphatidylglycerophosphate/cardiolipin synthase-like enzyme